MVARPSLSSSAMRQLPRLSSLGPQTATSMLTYSARKDSTERVVMNTSVPAQQSTCSNNLGCNRCTSQPQHALGWTMAGKVYRKLHCSVRLPLLARLNYTSSATNTPVTTKFTWASQSRQVCTDEASMSCLPVGILTPRQTLPHTSPQCLLQPQRGPMPSLTQLLAGLCPLFVRYGIP